MKTRKLDWKYADIIWRHRKSRETVLLIGVSKPTELRTLGYCVVAARGCLRVCVKDGYYWIVGMDTNRLEPVCLAVRSDVKYLGDKDEITNP